MKTIPYIIYLLISFLYANTGSISGVVIDSDTHQPLIGANIIIDGFDIGTSCDNNGKFIINSIPVGSYTIKVSMIGYSNISRGNINIYTDRNHAMSECESSMILDVIDRKERNRLALGF